MADTYYAWSDIRSSEAEETTDVKVTKAGETVTASDLGVSDEEFQALVESGAVKTEEYPELPEGYTGSPAQYEKEKVVAQATLDEAQAVLDSASGKDEEAEQVAKDTAKASTTSATADKSK